MAGLEGARNEYETLSLSLSIWLVLYKVLFHYRAGSQSSWVLVVGGLVILALLLLNRTYATPDALGLFWSHSILLL